MSQFAESQFTVPNAEVQVAPLNTINYSRLSTKDLLEVDRLIKSCEELGFFYLDLENHPNGQILKDVNSIFRIIKDYFEQPLEVKKKDVTGVPTHGFKPLGAFTGAKEYSRDGFEALKVLRDTFFENDPTLPCCVKGNIAVFKSFMSLSTEITETLLSCLSDGLDLKSANRFEHNHRTSMPSRTSLILMSYPQNTGNANVGHNKHTDIGSLTLLFIKQLGLEVQMPGTDVWRSVAPRDGHAVVNVGDCLRYLSRKRFKSCLHRVIPPSSLNDTRYSIGFFLRPADEVPIVAPDGKQVSAKDWVGLKYTVHESKYETQERQILVGGME